MALGNGLTETRLYNPRLQPTQIQLGSLLWKAGTQETLPNPFLVDQSF